MQAVAATGTLLALLLVFVVPSVTAAGVGPGSAVPPASGPTPVPSNVRAPALGGAGTPLAPFNSAHPLSWSTPEGPRTVPATRPAGANNWSCDPSWPSQTPIGVQPLGAATLLFGNLSGPTPLNLSWSISVWGGGIPPYQAYVEFEPYVGGNLSWNYSGFSGSISLTTPGMYVGVVQVFDATCDAGVGTVIGPVTVYGVSGVDPVQISASTSGGASPLSVRYSENRSRVPGGYEMLWHSPYSNQSVGWSLNTTYYGVGNDTGWGCLVNESTSEWLACGSSPNVPVSTSVLTTAVTVGSGSLPVNLTFWVNLTNTSIFPAGWHLDLWTDNGTLVETFSQNLSTNVTARFGCGASTPTNPPNTLGQCTWTASYLVTASPGGVPEFVTEGTIWTNLTANGTPAAWYPTVAYTESPSNGSAPLNVTVNLTGTNGLAPYDYWWAVFGASNGSSSQSFYPTTSGNGTGWNGSTLSLPFAFDQSGLYMITLTVRDSNRNSVFLYPPVLTIGVPLAHVPLSIAASEGQPATGGSAGVTVSFVANVSGGTAPYTIQWSWGDGTFGSSQPGDAVSHTYSTPGTYTATVTATDGTGASRTNALPAVTVPVPAPRSTAPGPNQTKGLPPTTTPPGPSVSARYAGVSDWIWAGGAALAVAFAGAVIVQARRRRSAEALLAGLERDADTPAASWPEDPPPGPGLP